MKTRKLITIIIIVIALAAAMTFDVYAGGDKQRGDVGQGSVNQHWVMPPWWALN